MEWINDFEKALLSLDNAISEFGRSNPVIDDVAEAIVGLNKLKTDFALVYDGLANIVSLAFGDIPEFTLPDGSKIEKRGATDRKSWKHLDLAAEVARRLDDISVDMDTGERTMSAQEMVIKVLDYVQPSYWRVKELGKIGISADKFCEVGETKESIIVRKAK